MNCTSPRPPSKPPSDPPATAATAVHVVVPGPLATPTGGFVYDRQMIAALAARGRLGSVIALPDHFPDPPPATLARAGAAIAALPADAWLIVDGLALPALAPVLGGRTVIALVHHPLCDETGLDAAKRQRLFAAERDALATVRHVIVTSAATARRLHDFGVPQSRVAVVAPAVDDARPKIVVPATRRRPMVMLCVGSLVPRKGHDLLLRALARLRPWAWRLEVVGAARDGGHARRLRRLADALGLRGRVVWRGAVSAAMRDRLYRACDVLVHPARYEGYGMAPVEAVAHGRPVVAFDIAAVREAVPAACRRLVPAGNVAALAAALGRLVRDPAAARALGWRARRAAGGLRRWSQAGAEFTAAVAAIVDGHQREHDGGAGELEACTSGNSAKRSGCSTPQPRAAPGARAAR